MPETANHPQAQINPMNKSNAAVIKMVVAESHVGLTCKVFVAVWESL